MRKILNIFILILLASNINAQTKEINSLREEQKKTRERLAATSKLLDENKKTTRSTLDKFNLLTKQIRDRQLLISQINKEIILLGKEIEKTNQEIEEETAALEKVKKEYAQLMYHAYFRRDSHNKLMFILSAESLDQSYRRLRYMQEFSQFRKAQGEQIKVKTVLLETKRNELHESRQAKEIILAQREEENKKLRKEREEQSALVAELQKDESKLRSELRSQQKKIDEINNKITRLIAEEARREAEARKRQQQQQKAPTQQDKEGQLVSGNFEKNKGRMPWPVEKGVIVGRFGVQPHPILPHLTINNKGIYIETEKDTDARSIFEGVVTQRFTVPGSNNAVIVRHGDYRTVYSNLTDIYVKEGDKVTAKQKIGKIFTDVEDGNKTTLYLMLWKETDLLNPETFLAK